MFGFTKRLIAVACLALVISGCGGNGARDGSGFQHDEAQTLFLEALKVRPTNQDQALELLDQSIEANPTFNAYFHRAWLYALNGTDDKASEDIKAGLAMEPASTDLKWLEGEMKKPSGKRKLDMPPLPKK